MRRYAKNKERIRDKKAKNSFRSRKRNLQYVVDYLKENGCVDCGNRDFRVLEFDHVDRADKIKAVSDFTRGGYSIDKLKKEMEKCEVRCANCHRIKSSIQLKWYEAILNGGEV